MPVADFNPDSSGTYYIDVAAYSSYYTGTYTVNMTFNGAAARAASSSESGEIELAGVQDPDGAMLAADFAG
jgi:hypothetical protein